MIPEEHDSTAIIVAKLIILLLTVFVAAVGSMLEGIKILKFRFRKNTRMGFTKDVY